MLGTMGLVVVGFLLLVRGSIRKAERRFAAERATVGVADGPSGHADPSRDGRDARRPTPAR